MLNASFDDFIQDTFEEMYDDVYGALSGLEADIEFVIENENLYKQFDEDACLPQYETRWTMRGLPKEYGKIPKSKRGKWLWGMASYLNKKSLDEGWWKEHQWYHCWYAGTAYLIHMDKHGLQAATGKRGTFKATEVYIRREHM